MGYKVFDTSQCEEWDAIVCSFSTYDIYYLSGYVKAFERTASQMRFPHGRLYGLLACWSVRCYLVWHIGNVGRSSRHPFRWGMTSLKTG